MSKRREKNSKSLVKELSKSGAKESEFRLKKHKNELHILKMSQEWDLRRQKRRMDRQKWIEERRKQQLPIWQRVGNLRVRANDEILHEAGQIHVNNKGCIGNSNEKHEVGEYANTNEMKEKMKQHLLDSFIEDKTNAHRVQKAISLVHNKTERTVSNRNSPTSNSAKEVETVARQQLKTSPKWQLNETAGSTEERRQKGDRGDDQDLSGKVNNDSRSQEQPTEHGNSVNEEHERTNKLLGEPSPAVSKPLMNVEEKYARKRKADEICNERKEPKLMCAAKPTTLERISYHSGVVSTVSGPVIAGHLNKNEKGEKFQMPLIKKCYSLSDHNDDSDVIFMGVSTSKTTPSTVSMTTVESDSRVQGRFSSASVSPKCMAYLSRAASKPPPANSTRQPQGGYLVPVYKQQTRDTVHAVLTTGAPHPPRGRESPISTIEQPAFRGKSETMLTVACSTDRSAYSSEASKFRQTALPPSVPGDNILENSALQPSHNQSGVVVLSQPTQVIKSQQNPTIVQSTREVHEVKVNVNNVPSATEQSVRSSPPVAPNRPHWAAYSPYVTHAPEQASDKNGVSKGIDGVLSVVTEQSMTCTPDRPRWAAFPPYMMRPPDLQSTQNGSTQEAIFNPMCLYVRPRLVPREVATPVPGSEADGVIVDYIKTDAICDQELTKWSAKNVADFVAATDCVDKSSLFLQEEIDGKALLSLSPELLIKGMNLKLGPAVKLYNHIANLRTALLL